MFSRHTKQKKRKRMKLQKEIDKVTISTTVLLVKIGQADKKISTKEI